MLVFGACTDSAEDDEPQVAQPSPSATQTAEPEPTETPSEPPTKGKRRLKVLGHEDFGGRGFNGDVWALGDYAYVGMYGGKTEDADCPSSGVKIVDISDPSRPKAVGALDNAPNTTAEDIVVQHVETKAFTGDVAAAGIQACNLDEGAQPETFRGLQFFDVTNPRRPKELSRWPLPTGAPGCHEIDFVSRGKRVLAGCASPFSSEAGYEEAYVVDVSDPRSPEELFGWSLPGGATGGAGCLAAKIVHNVRFSSDATRLYVSNWDAGTPILDISSLRNPRLLGIVEPSPLDADGDNHSVAEIPGDRLILLHEDFSPALPETHFGGCGTKFGAWGSMRIYDIAKPRNPKLLSEFATENMKKAEMTTPEIFTAHNAEIVGRDDAFVSWYSDGIRWVDVSDPSKPREIDAWVPPATKDPHGFLPKVPVVWGVFPLPDSDVILASDINSGLWVLQAEGLDN